MGGMKPGAPGGAWGPGGCAGTVGAHGPHSGPLTLVSRDRYGIRLLPGASHGLLGSARPLLQPRALLGGPGPVTTHLPHRLDQTLVTRPQWLDPTGWTPVARTQWLELSDLTLVTRPQWMDPSDLTPVTRPQWPGARGRVPTAVPYRLACPLKCFYACGLCWSMGTGLGQHLPPPPPACPGGGLGRGGGWTPLGVSWAQSTAGPAGSQDRGRLTPSREASGDTARCEGLGLPHK